MKLNQILRKASLVLLISVSQHLVAQGSLIVNGGFDIDASSWATSQNAYFVSTKGDPGGWIGLDSLSPSLSSDPITSQLVNDLIPGQLYLISGNFERTINRDGNTTDFSFGVAIDNIFLFQSADPGDAYWHNFSFYYTAASNSVLLSLSSQINGTGVSYGIDNIAMYAVPEPTTITLFGLGVAGLGLWRRQNQ